jgi:hypothetical protein
MVARNWSNTAGGDWSNPTNWTGSVEPGNGDSVDFASGSYTSVIDTGFPLGAALDVVVLSANVILDVQQSITVNSVIGSRTADGTDSGLLEVGNGAVLTYTAAPVGDINNQVLYIKSDGVGAPGEVIFTAATLGIDAGSVITMDGVNFDARGIVDPSVVINLVNGATFTATASDAFNDGTIALSGGMANLADIGDLSNSTGNAADQVVDMGGSGHGELLLPDTAAGLGLTIEGFGVDDEIGVAGISVKSATYDASQHLNLFSGTNGTGSLLAQLTGVTLHTGLTATLGASQFSVVTNAVGTFIELTACFSGGTLISAERGEVAVEDLRVGDRICTVLDGKTELVIWIGRRYIDCRQHPRPQQVWPIRIATGAFGPGRPRCDLWLSPDHAVYVGDALIPIKYLVNGTSITQVINDAITYYHVELPRHNIVLANGLPAESYLDIGDRRSFENCNGTVALHPDFASRIWEAEGCAPLVVAGPKLAAARRWVSALATAKHAELSSRQHRSPTGAEQCKPVSEQRPAARAGLRPVDGSHGDLRLVA